MPRAWLARFGRTLAEQVVDGVQAREEAPRGSGAHARIAGRDLSAAGGLDADYALAGWPAGTPEQPHTMSGGELLAGSAFSVTAAAAEGGSSAALWGRGGWSRFDGREESLSVDGEVATALLGAEVASGAWLGGVMLSHARGDGSYRSDADAGTVASALPAASHRSTGLRLLCDRCRPCLLPSLLGQLVTRLHPHPVLGGSPPDAFQRQGHGRGYARPTVQQARQGSALAAQASCRLGDVPPGLVHALPDQFAQMRRIQHGAYSLAVALVHVRSSCGSVIVHQVHVHDFAALESEHHAPVAGHAHAPLAGPIPFHGV